MNRKIRTNNVARPNRRGFRLATLVASAAVITGGIALPASAAVASPVPAHVVGSLPDRRGRRRGRW
ncbi:hypothetical protein ACFSNO_07640 [Streptomyces cirratus]